METRMMWTILISWFILATIILAILDSIEEGREQKLKIKKCDKHKEFYEDWHKRFDMNIKEIYE